MVMWDDQKQLSEIGVWEAATGKPLSPSMEQKQQVLHASFSSDGSRIVTASQTAEPARPAGVGVMTDDKPGEGRVWDAVTGQPISPPLKHPGAVQRARFSPDGRRVTTVSHDKTARLWDAVTGQALTPPLKHDDDVRDVVFSPDGRRLLTFCRGDQQAEARVWDTATGQPLTPPLKHAASIQHAAFSPDGRGVVTASRDKTARIWDAATGRALSPPLNHQGEVVYALFSPDGRLVVTADDQTMRVWDAATGQAVTPVQYHRWFNRRDSVAYEGLPIVERSDVGAPPVEPAGARPVERLDIHVFDRARELLDDDSLHLRHVAFSADSRNVILYSLSRHERSAVAGGPGTRGWLPSTRITLDRNAWDLRPNNRPLSDLVLLTQLITEHQLDATGARVPVQRATLEKISQTLPEKYPQDFSLPARRILAWHRGETVQCAEANQCLAAVFHLDRLLNAEPTNESLYLRRGQVHGESGEWDNAATDFARALDLKADAWDAWRHLGWIHQAMGKYQEAIADYTKAIDLNAADAWTWKARGSVYAELEQWRKAAADFARSRGLSTDDPHVPIYHAFALAGAGDIAGYRKVRAGVVEHYRHEGVFFALERPYILGLDPAQEQLRGGLRGPPPRLAHILGLHPDQPGTSGLWAALILPPDGADPAVVANMAEVLVILRKTSASLNTFGAALYRAGQFEQSVRKLTESIEASEEGGSILDWLFLAMAHHRLGHGKEARQWLRQAEAALDQAAREERPPAGGEGPTWNQRLLLRLLRREAADLLKGTVLDPKEEKVEKLLKEALAVMEMKDYAKAVPIWTEVIKFDPKNPQAYYSRGNVYSDQADYQKAGADFATGMELKPSDSNMAICHALALAGAGNRSGYGKACAGLVERYRHTEDPKFAHRVVFTCVLLGETPVPLAELISRAEKTLDTNPKSGGYLTALGAALYRAGRFKEAVQKLEAATTAEVDKATPYDWLFLAMANQRLNRPAGARKWLNKAVQLFVSATPQKAARIPWDQRVQWELLRREAEAVLKLEPGDLRNQEKVGKSFSEGWAALEQGNHDKAIASFSEVITLDPTYEKAYTFRGAAYNAKKECDKAIADFTRAMQLNPVETAAYVGVGRGLAYLIKKDYNAAIADFTRVIQADPEATEAYLDRGIAYSETGDYDKAIADYNKAVELAPRSVGTLVRRGHAYFEKNDYDKAIADYSQAIQLDPKNAEGYYSRARAYLRKQDYDKTIADASRAIQLDPKSPVPYIRRGDASHGKGDYDKAIADYTRAIELDPQDSLTYQDRGSVYFDKKDYDKAIADFSRTIERNPKNGDAFITQTYRQRGLAYWRQGKLDQALADYAKIIELNPKDADAYDSRGRINYLKKEYDRAIADFTKAIELAPKDAESYRQRALAYWWKRNQDKAIADYSKAIELEPQNAEAFVSRAAAHAWKKNYDKAIADYNQALKLDPKNADALARRGDVYAWKKDFDQAILDYDQAIKLDAKNADAYAGRGYANWRKKQYVSATADFEKAIQVDPKSPEGYQQFAWMLATCPEAKVRNGKKAVEYAIKACELTSWKDGDHLDTLAAAHAEAGRLDEAIKWQKKALEFAGDFSQEQLEKVRWRLKLYEQGKPYRDD
jgi:tetratricopeptide (TPR) repeat protein